MSKSFPLNSLRCGVTTAWGHSFHFGSMESGFGVLPFIGDHRNCEDVTARGEPASDDTGFGGSALFGHEDPVLDSVPEVSLKNMDGCLQNSSEGYSPGFSELFDSGPVWQRQVTTRNKPLTIHGVSLSKNLWNFSGRVVFGQIFLELMTVKVQRAQW